MKRRQYDPKTLVNTVANRFEFFREFHRISELEEGGVNVKRFSMLVSEFSEQEVKRLFDYDLIVEEGGRYELATSLSEFLAFVMGVQRPLQAAELEKSLRTVVELLANLRTPTEGLELRVRESQLHALRRQIASFEEDVIGHTLALSNALERLRDQESTPSYLERAKTADLLMRQYVAPTTELLEARNELSARRVLKTALEQINRARISTQSPTLERYYSLTELQLERVRDTVVRECMHTTREVLPLLQRIRQEGALLASFDDLLHHGASLEGPPLMSSHSTKARSKYAGELAYSFRQNLKARETPVFVSKAKANSLSNIPPPLPSAYFVDKLMDAVPVLDYFAWCAEQAQDHEGGSLQETFLLLTSTPFSYPERFTILGMNQKSTIRVGDFVYNTPSLRIEAK